jgi:hypothetical protein
MKSKKLVFLFVVLVSLSSCKKDAQLDVNQNNYSFSQNSLSQNLLITNKGGKDLEWSITKDINYLNITPSNGAIKGGDNQVIKLNAIRYYEPGTYSSSFQVSTNGGNKNNLEEMTLDFTPSILPGVGINDMGLGKNYSDVKNKYDVPDDI